MQLFVIPYLSMSVRLIFSTGRNLLTHLLVEVSVYVTSLGSFVVGFAPSILFIGSLLWPLHLLYFLRAVTIEHWKASLQFIRIPMTAYLAIRVALH